MAMANLPNNGAALLQCALVYIRELNNKVKGYQLLCSGLDNDYSNKDAILSTITSFLDDIKKYPTIYDEICSAVNECQTIGLNEYIPFLLARGDDNWKIITNEFSIVKGPVIKFKSDRHFDYGSVKIYKVNSSEERMSITQQDLFPEKSFTEKELKKKVDVFNVKGNESLMYKFIDPIIYGERYVVKKNLDYPSLRKAQFQGSDVFTVNQKEAECIVEFCQENEIKGRGIKIDLSNSKAEIKQKGIQYSLLDQYFLTEKSVSSVTTDYSVESSDYTYEMDYKGKDSLSFIPTRFESTTGDFLVIDLGDITRTIVTYKKKGRSWKPFSIERGGKITYVHPQDVLDPNRDGAMTKVWNGVKSTSSNVADKVSKATEKLGDAAGNVVTKVKDLLTKDEMPETGNN